MFSGLCVLVAFVTLGHALILSERTTRDIGRGYEDAAAAHLAEVEDLSDEDDDGEECEGNLDSSEELDYSPSGKVQNYHPGGTDGHTYMKSSAAASASASAYSETHH